MSSALSQFRDEHYDFVIPESRRQRPAVLRFLELLREQNTQEQLSNLGCCDGDWQIGPQTVTS